jgi:predicted lysophospholipase L1 biosynthesis ABC-type transport system permease subunit
MNPESTVVHPGLVAKAVAVISATTFWLLPFSPFVAVAALMLTEHSVGWPRRLSVAAALLCSVYILLRLQSCSIV